MATGFRMGLRVSAGGLRLFNLVPLGLSAVNFTLAVPTSGTIRGATLGSTITAGALPTGFTINGAARTFAYDGTGIASTPTLTLTETLTDIPGSPRVSSIALTFA